MTDQGETAAPQPAAPTRGERAQWYGARMKEALQPILALMGEAGKENFQIGWTNMTPGVDGKFSVNGLHVIDITTNRIDIK